MRESAELSAERKARVREAERRRECVTMLQIAECGCRYSASVLANGASPGEARATALEMASELSVIAGELRRLARLSGPERRAMARQLSALGFTRQEVADRLGVSSRAVYGYLRPRSPDRYSPT